MANIVRTRFVDLISKRRQLLALYLATQKKPAPQSLLFRQLDPAPQLRFPKKFYPRKDRRKADLLAFVALPPPNTATVPNVVGQQLAQATALIAAAHLSSTTSFQQSLTVPVDVILSESPAAGTVVTRGTSISLLVSLGASIVPNVVGEQLDQGVAVVVAAGLVPQTAQQPTNSAPPGTILAQLPGAGTAVLAGSVVSLIVAVTPPTQPQGGPQLLASPLALQRGLLQDLWEYWGGDVASSNTGDLATASGTIRSQQRVLRRLLTNPGDYIWHPEYGAGLPSLIGTTTDVGAIRAVIQGALALEDSVAQDPPPVITITPFTTDRTGYSITIQYVNALTDADTVLSFNVGV